MGRERNVDVREKHRLVAFYVCSNWDQTCSLGVCPDWELNLQPFGALVGAPTN